MFKRVLTVSEPGRDGVFYCVRDWLRHLRDQRPGIILDLAYSSRRGSPELDDFLREFSSVPGERVDLQLTGSPQLADLSALFTLWRMIRTHRPDLIHAHSSKAGGLVRLFGMLPGVPPILYSPHAYYGMGGQGRLKEKFFTLLEKILAPFATTICCSEDEAAFAREVIGIPESRLAICHHGMPAAAFKSASAEEKLAARKELGLPETGPILLTVGRHAPQKNYGSLYESLPSIFSETKFSLAHVGFYSTELRDTLPEDCRPRVFAWDHVRKERMTLFYQAADGYIMTSRYEGFSLAVLEALAQGLPLILTDVPGFRVYRKLGFDVRWVALNETDFHPTLVHAIVDWETSGEFRLPQQVVHAEQCFLQPRQLAKLEAIYEEILPAAAARK